MKGLQILNAVILALNLTFAVVLGVVTLIYSFYLDAGPSIRDEWRMVGVIALIFVGMSLMAALAFWGVLRRKAWHWPAQGLLLLSLVFGGSLLVKILGS